MTLEEILTFWCPELNPAQKKRLIIEIEKWAAEQAITAYKVHTRINL